MRLPTYDQTDRGRIDVKMTPMIDVVFQLLIFFVCTVSFQALEEVLPTHLRASGGSGSVMLDKELLELEDVIVRAVRQDGRTRWRLNDRGFDRLADLRGTLEQ